ncbi:hypothetical protein ACWD4O_43900, partial [Streptomyces sp. NPDC002623]
MVRERERHCRAGLRHRRPGARTAFQRDHRHPGHRRCDVAGGEPIGPYLTLMRGMAFERDDLRWGEMAL